ncbi:MAG: hypothetical protein ACI4E5_03060 [Suilimivivens sp.]
MKVKLQEVLEALEGAGMEIEYNPELMEEISGGFIEDFTLLPRQYDINEYCMMEDFIYELQENGVRDMGK